MGDRSDQAAVEDPPVTDGHAQSKLGDRDLIERIVETSPTGIAVYDPSGEIVSANTRAMEMADECIEVLIGRRYDAFHYCDEDGTRLPADEHVFARVLDAGEPVFDQVVGFEPADRNRRWLSISGAPVTDASGEIERVVVVAEEVTERRERERELDRQHQELERLARINRLIRRTNRALVEAVSREAIERAVCEELTGADGYAFAWIGDPHATNGRIEARSWAGRDSEYLEAISITLDEADTARGPTGRAIESLAVETTADTERDPAFDPWREAAIDHDFGSSACVPLVYDETVYGVLNLYAEEKAVFRADEREVLGELGETVGYAINAVQSKRLLLTNQVTELEFHSESSASFFIDICQRTGGELWLDGIVPSSEHADLYYMTIAGVEPETVLALAAETEGIEGRVVSDSDGEGRFEFLVEGASITRSLLRHGARVKRGHVAAGVASIIAEVSPDADVRTVVESIQEGFPGTELVAKQDVERAAETDREFRGTVEEALTERQAAALKAAFYTGYFEWPRASSAEEVAATMDIASPTFHQHLRAAHRKLLTAFFEE
jgi:HTH-type transcriptional regulator, bacterioopsin transcriptional activator and related proteins